MVDDLLSGMGLAIGYAVALSLPVIGGNLALGIWGAPYPGNPAFEDRMYIAHVLLLPVLIGVLIAVHLTLVASRHHTQFRKTGRESERRVVGIPTFPAYAPRSLGLLFAVAALLFLLGGLVQINPIWQWGPYETGLGTNGAQPDWYLGWLIGALRLVPGFDLTIGDYTLVPNPFWGGALFPLIVLVVLAVFPWAERRITRDYGFHNVLDRPRDAPGRTAFGAAFFTWVAIVFVAGASDRVFVYFGIPYIWQVWFFRAAAVAMPLVVWLATSRFCRTLVESERYEERRKALEEGAPALPG
jgi:ubiquinol-cytochrome c reductase cytochrome b subunit